MDQFPTGHHEFGSIADIRARLQFFRQCRSDHDYLAEHQSILHKLLFHSLNTHAVYHDAVETLVAVSPFAYRQVDQTIWQRITEDALLGALDLGDRALQAKVLNLLTHYQIQEGRRELARKNVEQALTRALEENDELVLLWAYIRFFEILVFQPRPFSRHELIGEVLTLAERVNHAFSTATLHYTLGQFYMGCEDYERALGHAQVAYAIARRLQEPGSLIRSVYALVSICRTSGCAAAVHFLKVAKSLDTARVSVFDQITAIMQESALYYEMGQLEAAAEGYRDAIRLLQGPQRPMHLAQCLNGLALAQMHLRQFDKAEASLDEAGKIWDEIGSAYEIANDRFFRGMLEAARGNHATAIRLLDDALLLTNQVEQTISRDGLRRQIVEFMQQVAAGELKDERWLGHIG